MADIRKQFEDLQTRKQNFEKEMAVATDRKNNLEVQLKEINLKLEGMGIDPNKVQDSIAKLESELAEELNKSSLLMKEAEDKLAIAKSVLG